MTGEKFGRLKVVRRDWTKRNRVYWICICDCGNVKSVESGNLKSGHVTSCGCYQKERRGKSSIKRNTIVMQDNYCIGYTMNTNDKFLFDIDDLKMVSSYCWYKNENGYVYTRRPEDGKQTSLHRMLLGYPNCQVDHANNNRLDNRRVNLRLCDDSENAIHKSKSTKQNKRTIIGVYYDKYRNKWVARFTYRKKNILHKRFSTIEEAIVERLKMEQKYCGEFAPNKELFEVYLDNNED